MDFEPTEQGSVLPAHKFRTGDIVQVGASRKEKEKDKDKDEVRVLNFPQAPSPDSARCGPCADC